MSVHEISIPVSAFVVKTAVDNDSATGWETEYTISIDCGPVTVFERKYTEDPDQHGEPSYAYNMDDAIEKALTEFGNQFKELMK